MYIVEVYERYNYTSCSISLGHTELLDIYNELETVAPNWRGFGFQLKLKLNDLDEIERDCHTTKDRFLKMLSQWHKSTKSSIGNWRTIYNALQQLKETRLAQTVAWKYGMHLAYHSWFVVGSICDQYAKHQLAMCIYMMQSTTVDSDLSTVVDCIMYIHIASYQSCIVATVHD